MESLRRVPVGGREEVKRGTFHTEETKRKMRGRISPLLGRNHTEGSKRKIAQSLKGHIHTDEAKRKMSEVKLGKKFSDETRRLMSEAHMGHKHTEDHKRKISEALKGRPVSEDTKGKLRRNHKGGPRKCFYNDIWFRSGWEVKVTEYLDKMNISWLYEPHVFVLVIDGKETTYCPDFFLPEFGIYYEVKGWNPSGINNTVKVFAAREQHNLNITVFDYKLLKRLGVI